jgi:predicted metal-dependent peptidase
MTNELLRQAILKILFKSRLRIFGCLIYKFDIKLSNDEKIKTAICTIDKINKKPVIIFNNSFIENNLPKVENVVYVLLHEMLHFIDGHLSNIRCHEKHDKIFNIAADHIINTMLDAEAEQNNALIAPNEILRLEEFKGKTPTLMEVYEWLMENKKFYDIKHNPQTDLYDVYENGKYIGSFSDDIESNDIELSKEISEELRAEIRSALKHTKNRANSTSDLFKYIENLVEIKIPWNVILENDIQKTRVKSNVNKSWKSLRKKLLHLNVTLPSSSTEEIQDNLYIVQDTSGSLWNNTEEQNKFLNLIMQSVNYFKTVKVIQHDTEIKSILDIDRNSFESIKHKIFEMHGGGGTSHNDVFSYIETKYFEEQEEIGIIVMATDYYSDIESIWNNFEFHNFVPIKILCTSDSQISKEVDSKPIYV